MTYFISPEYQKVQQSPLDQEPERSDQTDGRPARCLQDILQETIGISEAFKTGLASLDKAVLGPHMGPAGALGRPQWANRVTRHHILIRTEKIWRFSRPCALGFLAAAPTALTFLSKGEFNQWFDIGRGILKSDPAAVELCSAYFQAGPELIKEGAIHFMAGWVEQLQVIASVSFKTALAFCRATAAFVSADRAFHLRKWAETIRHILETGKGSEAAAMAFIASGTRIVEKITFKELRTWGGIGVKIAAHSPGSALTYFSKPPEGLTSLFNSDIVKFLDLTFLLADVDLGRAMEFYQRCPEELISLNPRVRGQVLDASRTLAAEGPEGIPEVFNDMVSSLRSLFYPMQEKVMESGLAIGLSSLPAARAYFKRVGFVLSEINEQFLPRWTKKGLVRLAENEQAGIDYFLVNSGESRSELMRWKQAVLLEDHRKVLSRFAHALSGRKIKLRQRRGLAPEKAANHRRYPVMDDKTVFLPAFFVDEPERQDNFRLYKMTIAHHAGHMEFKTFCPLFERIIALIEAFPLNRLARDIFFIIEDGRIDFMLRREYRGLKADMDQTVAACMDRRPFSRGDELAAALEILLRLTLDCLDETGLSQDMGDLTRVLKKAMDGFFENARGVWDSFQKTVELYASFSGLAVEDQYIPVSPLPFRGRPNFDFPFKGSGSAHVPEGMEKDETGTHEPVHSLTEEDIQRLLEKMKDPKFLQDLKEDPLGEGRFIIQIEGLTPVDAVDAPVTEGEGINQPLTVSPARSAVREGPFYYDEWDYLHGAYRRKWCTLREMWVPENDLGLFDKIYDNYSDLILKVKKQFQRIRPEVLEIVRRVEWGPEIDFNAMLESVVDRKVGDAPSDRIFTRMEKKVRRISTVLLVDMSASTDRLVSRVNPPGQRPRGESEKTGQSPADRVGRQEKKIIDVEIEGLVVITEALESLGDDYAIYGFSGYGREQVDFYCIKDFDDPYSETIKSRICGIRPQKGTRMGPAIRHAVEKLNRVDADHRLLVLLSDGFPQDMDYGEDRSSKDYALHDTMMALAEARKFGIRPFCITVDLAGDDYLRKMWDPGSYLIVKDVYSLPEVLPKVVESLVL